jgi:hypothetical protein
MSEQKTEKSEADGALATRFARGFGLNMEQALESRTGLERKSTRTPAERARKSKAPRKLMNFKLAPEVIELLRETADALGISMTDIVEQGIQKLAASARRKGDAS